MPPVAITTLRAVKEQQEENEKSFGEAYDSRGFVCAWEDGKPFDPEWIGKQWSKLVKADANIPAGVRFHDLRHTHASLLLSQGLNIKIVQERLGHKSISTTGDIYSHVTPGMQQEAADMLQKMFSGEEENIITTECVNNVSTDQETP